MRSTKHLLLKKQYLRLPLAVLFQGAFPRSEDYQLVSALFLRLLAVIYFIAFASIGSQIVGLVGTEGILPFNQKLHFVASQYGTAGWWKLPNIFWINASDTALRAATVAGCGVSILLFFNRLPRLSLCLLFVLYLSLVHAGQIFMNFQWDYLLLEAGFLAIFLPSGSRIIVWLFRWLLFRFRFLSGFSKLISGDPTWANLTALNYYFEVQPLPHWVSWYAHQLPDWVLRICTGSALFIELAVPFMMFLSRGPRLFAAWATILMQVLILLTSNHNFVNLLTICLCLFLFDDKAVRRIVPESAKHWLLRTQAAEFTGNRLQACAIGGIAVLILLASVFQGWEMISGQRSPKPVATIIEQLRPFRLTSNYHVFPTMKTARIEIVIEGSRDGQSWKPYEFKYKPGDIHRRPEIVVPHQPRLDWMMWFVPLGPPFLPWFEAFVERLLENAAPVTSLLESNPFPNAPPSYLRLRLFWYRFTDAETRAATGQWWTRDYLGPFYPLPWMARPQSASNVAGAK